LTGAFILIILHLGSFAFGWFSIYTSSQTNLKKLIPVHLAILLILNIGIVTGSFFFKRHLLGIDLFYIPSKSMLPTLEPGDVVLADTWANPDNIQIGDIIIFSHPSIDGMSIIKRVSALPSEETIRVSGDNPRNSLDSRVLGDIKKDQINAKAALVFKGLIPRVL
jgi:signal peptidase I